MPVKVVKRSGAKPWKIVNVNTNKVEASAETKAKAEASARARNASGYPDRRKSSAAPVQFVSSGYGRKGRARKK